VRDRFVDAAKRSVRLGFDAIELHLAHGYLLHSFVSPLANRRNDEWGGSLASRMRFPLEVTQAVRAVVPRGTPLGARITGTDWVEDGLTGDDAVVLTKALQKAGIDYVDISSGNITPESRWPSDPGFNVPVAEQVRRETGLAVRAVGMIAGVQAGRGDRRRGQGRHGGAGRALPRRPALGLARRADARRRSGASRANMRARRLRYGGRGLARLTARCAVAARQRRRLGAEVIGKAAAATSAGWVAQHAVLLQRRPDVTTGVTMQ